MLLQNCAIIVHTQGKLEYMVRSTDNQAPFYQWARLGTAQSENFWRGGNILIVIKKKSQYMNFPNSLNTTHNYYNFKHVDWKRESMITTDHDQNILAPTRVRFGSFRQSQLIIDVNIIREARVEFLTAI